MRQLPRQTQSPPVPPSKVRMMGGVATPLAGAPPPTVSSPGRYSGLTTPMYSHAPSTTYNPGYTPGRRYLSEGELLDPQQNMLASGGVGPSTSAGHIQVYALIHFRDMKQSPSKLNINSLNKNYPFFCCPPNYLLKGVGVVSPAKRLNYLFCIFSN